MCADREMLNTKYMTVNNKTSWDPPNIESCARQFNEYSRFYKTPKQTKNFGRAYAVAPGDSTTLKHNSEILNEIEHIKHRVGLHSKMGPIDACLPRFNSINQKSSSHRKSNT